MVPRPQPLSNRGAQRPLPPARCRASAARAPPPSPRPPPPCVYGEGVRVGTSVTFRCVIDSGVEGPHTRETFLRGVTREQKMLKRHLPRVISASSSVPRLRSARAASVAAAASTWGGKKCAGCWRCISIDPGGAGTGSLQASTLCLGMVIILPPEPPLMLSGFTVGP